MDTHEVLKDGKHPDPRSIGSTFADRLRGVDLFDVALLRERVELNHPASQAAQPHEGKGIGGVIRDLRIPPQEKPPMRAAGPRVSAQQGANNR